MPVDAGMCTSADEEFERRIEPLLTDDRLKSCNRCHLSGMDLGTFARNTACETMACLVEQELVDLERPASSTVLQWIRRAEPDRQLVTQELIDEEYDGFLSWIEYHAECGNHTCAGVTCGDRRVESCGMEASEGYQAPAIDRSDCSEPALETAFRDRVYTWRRRCFPCHHDGSTLGPEDSPRWIHAVSDCDLGAVFTLNNVESYIDIDNPMESLLITKPLAESEGGVFHIGHSRRTRWSGSLRSASRAGETRNELRVSRTRLRGDKLEQHAQQG